MYKGIYIALSGALLKQRHIDIAAQNVANANTNGYKKESISFKDYLVQSDNRPVYVENNRVMSDLSGITTDFSGGGIKRTGNPLDMAINGKGFFALEENRFTRNGNFKVSPDGYLATQDNIKVLGTGGPVAIRGNSVYVNETGEVFVDDVSVGQLNIVDFEDKNVLSKQSSGVFVSREQGMPVNSGISQGYLEGSNVEVVKELVRMMTSFREFESYQKMIRAFDEATSKTIDQMGR